MFTMTQPTKYLLGLSAVLLFSLYFQSSIDSPASSSDILSLQLLGSKKRGLELELEVEGTIGPRRPEVRKPIRTDEFWLTESDYAYLPFEINFVPPDDSCGKLQPVWSCHDPNVTSTVGRSKKLVYVHPVRTEADLITDLISSYATSCHAGYASTGKTQVTLPSLDSAITLLLAIAFVVIDLFHFSAFVFASHVFRSFMGVDDFRYMGESKSTR